MLRLFVSGLCQWIATGTMSTLLVCSTLFLQHLRFSLNNTAMMITTTVAAPANPGMRESEDELCGELFLINLHEAAPLSLSVPAGHLRHVIDPSPLANVPGSHFKH